MDKTDWHPANTGLGAKPSPDSEIAAGALAMFERNGSVPECVVASVENGWIMLTGEVTWSFQREAAEQAVRDLSGVVGISNHITLASADGDRSIRLSED